MPFLAILTGLLGGIPGLPGGESGRGASSLNIPDIVSIIFGIFGITFPTHRPDNDELPRGTQWLHGSPESGVIQHWASSPTQGQFRWRGEILATEQTDYPIAAWDYASQTFLPILSCSRDGYFSFVNKADFEANYLNPDSFWKKYATLETYQMTWDDVANFQSERDAHPNKYICEDVRGGNWQQMVDDGAYYAAEAKAHNIPFYWETTAAAVAGMLAPGTTLNKALKIGGSILGSVAGVIAIVKMVKK